MTESKNVLPIWQPVGFSTHLISQRIGEHLGVKTSHTGTLDPMAEGVIIVLLGEERLKKKEYAKWKKGYEFEIAVGISTDTYDGMGLITDVDLNPNYLKDVSKEGFDKVTNSFVGNYIQKVPPYSTKKIQGKHLHQITRSNKKISLPTKKGKIYKFDYLDSKIIKIKDLIQDIGHRILLVTGDFRQKEIIDNWRKTFKGRKEESIKIVKLYVEISKGMYVRSLAVDFCKKISAIGFTYSIKRVKNGDYTQENSKKLEEIFGENYKNKIDFVSRPNLR